MTKKMIKFHDAQTGEVIEREMNEAELAQEQIDIADFQAQKAAKAAKESEKAALLEQLGITAEQAKLLLS